jgi:hypothetical protein
VPTATRDDAFQDRGSILNPFENSEFRELLIVAPGNAS